MMKKLTVSILTLLLVCTLLTALGETAETTASPTLQSVTGWLDSVGVPYSHEQSGGNDVLIIQDSNASIGASYQVYAILSQDGQHVGYRIWNIATIPETSMDQALRICNQVNTAYRYGTFCVDETDNSLMLAYDLILGKGDDAATVFGEGLLRFITVLGEAYASFAPVM